MRRLFQDGEEHAQPGSGLRLGGEEEIYLAAHAGGMGHGSKS